MEDIGMERLLLGRRLRINLVDLFHFDLCYGGVSQ